MGVSGWGAAKDVMLKDLGGQWDGGTGTTLRSEVSGRGWDSIYTGEDSMGVATG
jgi:hypothetical protein